MTEGIEIRKSRPDDMAALEALYPAAFPDEDLLPLVRALLDDPAIADSYVACANNKVAGHIVFTACSVPETDEKLSLLAPLAVTPEYQRTGLGSALVRHGLDQQKHAGAARVLVLGDPNYYSRFGFTAEADVSTPYPIPAEWREAWQSLQLNEGERMAGVLDVPGPWKEARYWA